MSIKHQRVMDTLMAIVITMSIGIPKPDTRYYLTDNWIFMEWKDPDYPCEMRQWLEFSPIPILTTYSVESAPFPIEQVKALFGAGIPDK